MSQYLLSLHAVKGESRGPQSHEEMESFMERIEALETDMRASGAFLFTGGLHGPDAATVVRRSEGELLLTDGPFSESKEHLAGFYVIEAADLDAAIEWAGKVVDCIGAPIEVRPFFDSRSA
ncbi:MAG: YciI family protein [Acidimicrobiia bacterium]|nr:YciI family protein [Acidimicrobiia bacterium]MDH4307499.1 YciI family protein [Acidimicrobiia bacterium]MDH5293913.1 YciI family protein [Acidimicrobiia bacterium]